MLPEEVLESLNMNKESLRNFVSSDINNDQVSKKAELFFKPKTKRNFNSDRLWDCHDLVFFCYCSAAGDMRLLRLYIFNILNLCCIENRTLECSGIEMRKIIKILKNVYSIKV